MTIKSTEDNTVLESSLLALKDLLMKADSDTISHPVYQQAAYALGLNAPDLTIDAPGSLSHMKALTTPVSINENMYSIAFPTNDRFVILEKITARNQEAWEKYALNQYYSVSRIPTDDFDYTPAEWGKYLPNSGGLGFFKARISNWCKSLSYEIWAAYISCASPCDIAKKRTSETMIDPADICMVASVQMGPDLETYSPMGISRTFEEANKLWEEEKSGKKRAKLNPTEAMWFHVLTARITIYIHPNIKEFWTSPLDIMSVILAKALYPTLKIVAPSNYDMRIAKEEGRPVCKEDEILLKKFLSTPHAKLKITPREDLPWGEDDEFQGGNGVMKKPNLIQINVFDLWRTIFPH